MRATGTGSRSQERPYTARATHVHTLRGRTTRTTMLATAQMPQPDFGLYTSSSYLSGYYNKENKHSQFATADYAAIFTPTPRRTSATAGHSMFPEDTAILDSSQCLAALGTIAAAFSPRAAHSTTRPTRPRPTNTSRRSSRSRRVRRPSSPSSSPHQSTPQPGSIPRAWTAMTHHLPLPNSRQRTCTTPPQLQPHREPQPHRGPQPLRTRFHDAAARPPSPAPPRAGGGGAPPCPHRSHRTA